MKLAELLAREMDEWPAEKANLVQGSFGQVYICGGGPIIIETTKASDWELAEVTRAQWQAERDRQKGGEWKRHRGGKQPVENGVFIEVKYREGDTKECIAGDTYSRHWNHAQADRDIMQYRIISQPQAEEVDESGYQETVYPGNTDIYVDECSEGEVDVQYIEAKTDQIDGPIKWRDTIIHCQAIIEDCEREIQRNVDLLDAEGLMMQTDSKKAMQHYATSSLPFAEWLAGDFVVSKVDYNKQFTKGKKYKLTSTHVSLGENRVSVEEDDKGAANGWLANQFEFHSRP